jgi:acyl carrier protein
MTQHEQTIKSVIAVQLRVPMELLEDEFRLDELGLDSLTSAEVVLGVERRFGVRLALAESGSVFTRDTTLRDFVALLATELERAQCPS